MDTGLLDVFHDAADVDLAAVAQCIDVDLDCIFEESVYQYRTVVRDLRRVGDVRRERGLVVHDLHAASAENVGRTHQHRVADSRGDLTSSVERRRGAVLRCRQSGFVEHLAEFAPVLGEVDGLGRRSDDRDACGLQSLGESERGLSAELDDDAPHRARRRLGPVHLEDVLEGQWLEVQAVCGVVVGGDGFGIAIDHHRLVAGFGQCLRCVHTAVVEFDALTDAVGTRAEDEHLGAVLLRGHFRFGLGVELVGAVVVRGLGLELGSAGVDRLVDRMHTELGTQRPHTVLTVEFGTQSRDLAVGQTVILRLPQQRLVEFGRLANLNAEFVDLLELIQEPRVDLGRLEELLEGGADRERLLDSVHPTVLRNG